MKQYCMEFSSSESSFVCISSNDKDVPLIDLLLKFMFGDIQKGFVGNRYLFGNQNKHSWKISLC